LRYPYLTRSLFNRRASDSGEVEEEDIDSRRGTMEGSWRVASFRMLAFDATMDEEEEEEEDDDEARKSGRSRRR
jgi:hypothetical protein